MRSLEHNIQSAITTLCNIFKDQIYNYLMDLLWLLLYTNFSYIIATWTSDYEKDGVKDFSSERL